MTSIDRRAFLARTAAAGAAAGLAGIGLSPTLAAEPLVKGLPNVDKLGWRVGFSAYTFRALTAFEAIDQIAATGLRYAEMFSWQKLSPKHPDATTSPELSKPLRGELKAKVRRLRGTMIEIPRASRSVPPSITALKSSRGLSLVTAIGSRERITCLKTG